MSDSTHVMQAASSDSSTHRLRGQRPDLASSFCEGPSGWTLPVTVLRQSFWLSVLFMLGTSIGH